MQKILELRMSNLQQQRMVVEQLRREASIKRISVSQAVEDIKVKRMMNDVLRTTDNIKLVLS